MGWVKRGGKRGNDPGNRQFRGKELGGGPQRFLALLGTKQEGKNLLRKREGRRLKEKRKWKKGPRRKGSKKLLVPGAERPLSR